MKVLLDPGDLDTKHQTKGKDGGIDQAISTSLIRFEHLSDAAKAVVRAAGRAKFETWNGDNYNMVYSLRDTNTDLSPKE